MADGHPKASTDGRRGLVRIASAAPAAAALGLAALTVLVSFWTHSVLPHQDEWGQLPVFRAFLSDGQPLSVLFSQHNEHRSVFPRLVTYSDYLVFGGSGYLNLTVIFLLASLTTGLFLALHRRSAPEGAADAALGAMVPLVLFSLVQWENFGCGFQVEFVGVYAAACFAIALFARALAGGGRRWAVAAFALVAVATLTMANGLLAGLVLAVMAVLARAGRRWIAGPVLVTLVLAACYFARYAPPDDAQLYGALGVPEGDPDAPWPRPVGVLLFTVAYLGNFLDPDMGAAAVFGTGGLVALVIVAGRFLAGRDADSTRLALIGIGLFAAGSAFLTAVGRYPHEGIGGAMSSRYTTGSAVFWCALLVCGWSISRTSRHRVGLRLLVAAACLVLLVAILLAPVPTIAFLADRGRTQKSVEDAVLLGLLDRPVIASLFTDPEQVRATAPFLRERAISVFATPDARLYGRPVEEAGAIGSESCPGSFDAAARATELGPGGVRVAGTARRDHWLPAFDRVYIADAAGRIAGFATTPLRGSDWTGYAVAAHGPLHAFARRGRDRLCYLGAAVLTDGP